MGQCPADPEEHRALGSDPPVEEVPYPGGQQADSPYRSRRRRGCGTVGRRSRSRQGALGRRRRPAHTAPEMPQSRRSPRSAPPPAHHRHTGNTGRGCRGTPGGARLGSRDRALRVVRGEVPPAARTGRWGSRRLPGNLLEVAPRSLGPPGGAAAGQSRPLSPHLPPATWPHAPGPPRPGRSPPGRDPTWTDPRRPLGTGPSLPGEGNGSPGARSGHPPQKQPLAINKAAGHLPSRLMLEARRAFIDPLWAGAVVP